MSLGPTSFRKPYARFQQDRAEYSWRVAVLRAFRRARILAMLGDFREVSAMSAFRSHLDFDGTDDPLFFLAHPCYLAAGLTARQRMDAALTHYAHEERLGQDYFRQVYLNGGLTLWQTNVAGVDYDIRLMPGNDVLYEGGLSVVFHVDGGRVCVMSFSLVPRRMVLPGSGAGDIIFVTRKQLAQNHAYQKAFNAAFDRTTPAHMCFAALAGWALPQGFTQVVGIAAERHPSFLDEYAKQFRLAYSDFWVSLSGQSVSPLGYLVDLPSQLTPIEDLDSRRRKRAMTRRSHLQGVHASATEVAGRILRKSPGQGD